MSNDTYPHLTKPCPSSAAVLAVAVAASLVALLPFHCFYLWHRKPCVRRQGKRGTKDVGQCKVKFNPVPFPLECHLVYLKQDKVL